MKLRISILMMLLAGHLRGQISLIRDLCPSTLNENNYSQFTGFKNYLYYNASPAECSASSGLYRTDGTVVGTNKVSDKPFFSRGISGGHLYYSTGAAPDAELRRINGMTGLDELVKGGLSGPRYMTDLGGVIVFFESNAAELWRSDGTAEGTYKIYDVGTGHEVVSDGVHTFFYTEDGLWRTDGTTEGTTRIITNQPNYKVYPWLAVWKGDLYFRDWNVTTGDHLWKWPKGQSTPIHLTDGAGYLLYNVSVFYQAENALYFYSPNKGEIWKTDGTAIGTTLLQSVSVPYYFYNGQHTDSPLGGYQNIFFFPGEDVGHGVELWKSDGTPEGTQLVKDISPGAGVPTPEKWQWSMGSVTL